MNECDIKKGAVLIWRKDDPKHRRTIRVTQVTRNMVRAVDIDSPPLRYGSFWNPKCFIIDDCTLFDGDGLGKTQSRHE